MEEIKNIPEIPPLFNNTEFFDGREKPVKQGGNIVLFQIVMSALIIISLIAMKILAPEIYTVINAWLTEKLALPPFSL